MREYERTLCERVARRLPATCRPILLADRGFATTRFFRFLDALGWDWIIRSKGNILVQWAARWVPLTILGKSRPVQRDERVLYAKTAEDGPYAGRLVCDRQVASLASESLVPVSFLVQVG